MRVHALALLLADDAAPRGRPGAQALVADVLAAVVADTVFAVLDTRARRLDVADLLDVPVDEREAHVGERVTARLVTDVRGSMIDQLHVLLVPAVLQRVAHLLEQAGMALLERPRDLRQLRLGQCHVSP